MEQAVMFVEFRGHGTPASATTGGQTQTLGALTLWLVLYGERGCIRTPIRMIC